MKIGELARRAGLNASAIRYYERLGLLTAPYRSGGQRRYPDETLNRVPSSASRAIWGLLSVRSDSF
jgi:MerR family redox-sensitive transcriptional activator SoxR